MFIQWSMFELQEQLQRGKTEDENNIWMLLAIYSFRQIYERIVLD